MSTTKNNKNNKKQTSNKKDKIESSIEELFKNTKKVDKRHNLNEIEKSSKKTKKDTSKIEESKKDKSKKKESKEIIDSTINNESLDNNNEDDIDIPHQNEHEINANYLFVGSMNIYEQLSYSIKSKIDKIISIDQFIQASSEGGIICIELYIETDNLELIKALKEWQDCIDVHIIKTDATKNKIVEVSNIKNIKFSEDGSITRERLRLNYNVSVTKEEIEILTKAQEILERLSKTIPV